MSNTLLLGPILGFEQGGYYTVCLLTDRTHVQPPQLELSSRAPLAFTRVMDTPTGIAWRAEAQIATNAAQSQPIRYRVIAAVDGQPMSGAAGLNAWTFYVPKTGERARLAYASCNGFSSAKLARDTPEPYALWSRMKSEHDIAPFGLLLLGGDQLYADSIWALPDLVDWAEKKQPDMVAHVPDDALLAEFDAFYDRLYQRNWRKPEMALMLASIPSVMMWDDHDIFDGWGSHDEPLQSCPVYRAIYDAARKYFQLWQIRTRANRSLHVPAAAHFALALDYADFRILVTDGRSDRTVAQVMAPEQHLAVEKFLAALPEDNRPVLAMSAIPVVYRSFTAIEKIQNAVPGTDEGTDDVRDHWMASRHRDERTRLMLALVACKAPVWLLSGDVHVGALGEIFDTVTRKSVYQIVSTGIVHPPPSWFAWQSLVLATGDRDEEIPGTNIVTGMLTPPNGDRFLRDRNFAILQRDPDDRGGKLRVTWICEDEETDPNLRSRPTFFA